MKHLLWIILLTLVIIRYQTTKPNFTNGQKLRITGSLYSEPSTFDRGIRFNLSGIKVALFGKDIDIHYGDFVEIEGEYQGGELKKGKLVRKIESDNVFAVLRKRLIEVFKNSQPDPQASLLGGIVIGAKSNLPKDFSQKLRNTGTTHVVVASGMNITMMAEFTLLTLLKFFKRKKAVLMTIVIIWSYTMITGFEAPIIRAAIMGTVAFTAQAAGRVANTLRYTVLAALIMLIAVPRWITDIGFILSFATTISLILFQTKVSKVFKLVPSIIREDFSTSLAAQIGSAPILLFVFGRINPLSPLINSIILWIVAPVMIIGGIGGLVGIVWPAMGKIILLFTYPLTTWFITIVNLFG